MISVKKLVIAVFSALLLCLLPFARAEAGTIYDSPYVSISPDGKAWTTCPGDTHNYHYTPGYTVTTGLSSDLRPLQTGEHYYTFDRSGSIPIGRWTVLHQNSQCIHDYIPIDVTHKYHDVPYGTKVCSKEYTQGWFAYCADCGQPVAEMLMYMCEEAAKSITYIEAGTGMCYYYLCPNFEVTKNEDGSIAAITYCRHLEQGGEIGDHNCKKISWNRYKVVYDDNEASTGGTSLGTMQPSYHMYNNETTYEGETISPVTHLSKNGYTVPGYEFTGWNTKPNGSGTWYTDQQEIFNLTTADYKTDEVNGTITLYAQWERSDSTLEIDPAGGSYFENMGITSVTQPRLSNYVLNPSALAAPGGATLTFEANGGTAADGSAIAPIISTQHFVGWIQEAPFNGRLVDNTYYFLASKGNVDRVTAKYVPNPIELPEVKKENFTFGGWYYDADFKRVAGSAGDSILIYENTTLYANWVDLKLTSVENYNADVNGGKGAADLSWSQPDGNSKSYKVYQGTSADALNEITQSIAASGSNTQVSESFEFSGTSQTYTIPSTGLYTLEVAGAQGGGSLGNEVKGDFWLQEGDVLTYDIGGQNGYGGSETGTNNYETSGRTAITSAKEGLLLAAGGGGGHTHTSDCYTSESTTASNSFLNDYAILERDGIYADEYIPLIGQASDNVFKITTHSGGENTNTDEIENDTDISIQVGIGDDLTYFPTPGVGTFSFYYQDGIPPETTEFSHDMDLGQLTGSWAYYSPDRNAERIIRVYDTNDNLLMNYNVTEATHKSEENFVEFAECSCNTGEDESANDNTYIWDKFYCEDEYYSGWMVDCSPQNGHYCDDDPAKGYYQNGGTCAFGGTFTIDIPEEVVGIYIQYDFRTTHSDENEEIHICNFLRDFKYSYTANTCGQAESSGGASTGEKTYVNRNVCVYHESSEDTQTGDGYFNIESKDVCYLTEINATTVDAPDEAAPDAVDGNKVAMLPVEGSAGQQITVCWEQPVDNGTDYFFKAESYAIPSAMKLCDSNITKNTLVTGFAEYCYILDGAEETVVTATNGTRTAGNTLQVTLTNTAQYLHLAAIDKAGNLSSTTTINLGSYTVPPDDVEWTVYTDKITVWEGDGVYPAADADTYYVRCDERTPVELGFKSYMEGTASAEYQITHSIFATQIQGGALSRHIITTPPYMISDTEIVTDGSELGISVEGVPMLKSYMNVRTIRRNRNRDLDVVSQFVVGSEANGETIVVTPIAGVVTSENSVYSDFSADMENSICLIGDCEAPIIYGTDLLNEEMVIDRTLGDICLTLWAEDDISGMGEFCAQVYNEDNAGCYTFVADEDGRIVLNITGESTLFAGDFTITLVAVDNVGNCVEQLYHVTEFALETQVERILPPHEPVFQRGESGVLTVEVWGHVERVEVEFPDFLAGYSETFTYASPKYKEKETIQFMVPLEAETDGSYEIRIKAYKGGNQLEDAQVITVSGNVLDDLRTRIR